MKNRWGVLFAIWLLIFSYGASWFAVAPLLTDLEKEYGIGGAESHLLLSIVGLFVVFFAWPAGSIVDKKGPRASALIGSILMVLGFGGRALLNSTYVEILFFTAFAGIGLAWILVALAPQMIQWFDEKASLAIGLASSGLFLGFGTASFLSPYIKEGYGMDAVYRFFAFISFISFLVYFILGRDKGGMKRERISFMEGIRGVFSSSNAILYPLIGFLIVGTTLSASALLPKWLEENGMTETQGGNIIGLMLFGCALGAFSFPYIASKYGVKKTAVVTALLSILFWIIFYPSYPFIIYIMVAFLFGVFLQASWPIALHCQETEKGVDERNEGIASSLYISISNEGGAILPVIIGKIADESLRNAFFTILVYLIAFLILWSMVRRR